jgi:transposase InsO family protein
MIRALIAEAVVAGARRWRACEVLGLSVRTVERWGANDEDGRRGPNHVPANKLSEVERQKAVDVMTSPEFRDCSPKQIVPALATRGQYIGSEPTLYRILHALDMQHARGRERAPMSRPREYVADGPMQVAAWDITYLRSLVRGIFFYLYLVEDVWSRTIIGWAVHEIESADLAAALIEKIRRETPGRDLKGWVLHADNGGPMKGATMLATLQRLGVVSSFSRPSVSDDNAYAESLFRTMKYRARYPSTGFATVEDASIWVRDFVAWYNEEHQHSGIGYVPPAARHTGKDLAILAARRTTYEIARSKHPERWTGHARTWSRPETVTLNQKVDHPADTTASIAA